MSPVGLETKLSGLLYGSPVTVFVAKFTLCVPPSFTQYTVSPAVIVNADGE